MREPSSTTTQQPGRASRSAAPHASRVERLLAALGADPSIVESVFGDLAEERAERAARDGAAAAAAWHLRETARSLPPLAAAALQRLSRQHPARFATYVGAAALTIAAVGSALWLRDGPPARLAGASGAAVILNGSYPVRLPVAVRDARGRPLDSAAVRFTWLAGAPLRMNEHGDVTCPRAGDATVRAAIGDVATRLVVRCRPVQYLRAGDVDLVADDPPASLPMEALDAAGRPVSLLAGRLTFDDSSVASFVGGSVVPRTPGSTLLEISIGDLRARVDVTVHARARSLDTLRAGAFAIAVPVNLRDGETRRWPLPRGTYWLWVRERDDARPVRLAVLDSRCGPGDAPLQLVCTSRGESSVVVYRAPGSGAGAGGDALLLVHRVPDWKRVRVKPDHPTPPPRRRRPTSR